MKKRWQGATRLVVLWLWLAVGAQAFEVGRNVNTDAPADKLVLFERGGGIDHLEITTSGDGAAELMEDGRLRLRFRGKEQVLVSLTWKPSDGLPPSIDMAQYQALRLLCHLEGDVRVTPRKGGDPSQEELPDNTTISAVLMDGAGQWIWGGRLTAFTADGKTPRTAADVLVYLSMLTVPREAAPTDVRAIVFRMAPRGNLDRDYALILEKISFTK